MEPMHTRILTDQYKEYDKPMFKCPVCWAGMIHARRRRKHTAGSKTRTLVYFCDNPSCDKRWRRLRDLIDIMVKMAVRTVEEKDEVR